MNKKLNEFNSKISGKKVAVIGAGVSNISLFEYLYNLDCDITLFDRKSELNDKVNDIVNKFYIKTSLGENYLENLVDFDYIFRSPSMLPSNPYLVKEAKRGAVVTTEIEQVINLSSSLVIGITGSKGKTTTTTILDMLLRGFGVNTYVGGNIGKSLFTSLKDIKNDDVIVLELSSFQLMDMKVSPNISIVTNISPDHLDIHKDYQEYIDSKKSIFLNQGKNDVVVLNYDDEIVREMAKEAKGIVKFFSSSEKFKNSYYVDMPYIKYIDDSMNENVVLDMNDIKLKGVHNAMNICACLNAISDYVIPERIKDILADFTGVKHRLQFVREINGVKWYNDSASTTPDKARAGIMAFSEPITLICGGYDKNLDYKPLAEYILENVNNVVLFGQTKDKIYNEVRDLCNKTGREIPMFVVDSLEEVVMVANRITNSGEIVLFSPASASFDMFDNAYQRGDMFSSLVNKL